MLRIVILLFVTTSAAYAQTEPTGAYAEANGMRMYYEVSGEGEPVIVLHGAYMNIPAMGEIIPMLAQSRRVYAIELQGHGRSDDIDRPITYPALADDVALLMDRLDLPRADVFGYSMGAAVGFHLAVRHPDKVDQLVAASLAFELEGMQPEFVAMVPSMSPEMFEGTPIEADWRALAPNPDGFRDFAERMIALEHEPMDWRADVERLEAPVLLIAGDADVTTLEHQVEFFRLLGGGRMGDLGNPLPGSRLAILPATSHTAVIGQHGLLYRVIDQFLREETPRGMFQEAQ
ncbi:alpha/beta fold hydrolase [Afifella pfennigii]|uniref:alpha/beta fold hydrolase n=1 Tax=Afifella pfennigii TaxID=209897 RepID=UPI0004791008|nr:alpha/beta hydrolase [Afifella pfennigii]